MGSVYIGIGHDDDLIVAQLGDIKIIVNSRAEGGNHGPDLRVAVDLVQPGLLHVEDFSS